MKNSSYIFSDYMLDTNSSSIRLLDLKKIYKFKTIHEISIELRLLTCKYLQFPFWPSDLSLFSSFQAILTDLQLNEDLSSAYCSLDHSKTFY